MNKWYPEALKEFKVTTIFYLLLEYLRDDHIEIDKTIHTKKAVYHDPCNYGRKSMRMFGQAYYEEGRFITRSCCPDTVEMEPNRATNYCCGAGGGAWTMPFSDVRVFYGRIKARQIAQSGAQLVITTCHNCRDQIKSSLNKEFDLGVEVKYLWELVADSIVLPQGKKE